MNENNLEDFENAIQCIFHPEPDEDGMRFREYPNRRLLEFHNLNFDYMSSFDWEGSSDHKYTRLCPKDEEKIHILARNQDVPESLLLSALQLFADSKIAYHEKTGGAGQLRFFPPIILTFWAGFETFVRYSSELMILTVSDLPIEVLHFLQEEESYLSSRGEIKKRTKYQGILDRYAVFLKYAYEYQVDRGARFWQELEKAKNLRDYYTHLDISVPREISSTEVLSYMEAILLGIIVPSSHLQRTLMPGVYWLYEIWTTLYEYRFDYTERPFFKEWLFNEEYLFHCNFENVNKQRFPTMREKFKKE